MNSRQDREALKGSSHPDTAVVFIIDDDAAMLRSLSALLESTGLRAVTYLNADDFLAEYDQDQAGCLVLDERMPNWAGHVFLREMRELEIDIPVIMITGHGDVELAVECMKDGAIDFLQKPFREQRLLEAIQEALKRDRKNRGSESARNQFERAFALLTKREVQVLDLVVAGRSNKVIAFDLEISERTVEFHRANLMRKLGVDSSIALARLVTLNRQPIGRKRSGPGAKI